MKTFFSLFFASVFAMGTAQTTHHISWTMGVGGNASITIDEGDTVVWTNNDATIHNVVSSDANAPAGFGSATLNPGDTYSFTFNSAVVFTYQCGFHPGMSGTLSVLAVGGGSCTEPTNLVATSPDPFSIELSWDPSPDEVNGYSWVIMDEDFEPFEILRVDEGITASGVTTAQSDVLMPGTTYDVFVATRCAGSDRSDYIGPVQITTVPMDCPEVENLTVITTTHTTATLAWDEPTDMSNVLGYGLILVHAGDTPFEDPHVGEDFVNAGISAVMFDNLNPNTSYDFYINTECNDDPLFISDRVMVNFTTTNLSNTQNEIEGLSLYPNPVADVVNIDAPGAIQTVELFDLRGRSVNIQPNTAASQQWDLTALPQGLYLMKIRMQTGEIGVYRLIKSF